MGEATLTATRGTDIPSEALAVCVGPEANSCPAERGERIVGSPAADRIKGTAGNDDVRSRGGNDKVDLRKGGVDRVNCGKGRDTVRLKRKFANDGIVIKGSCERVRRS